MIGMIKKLERMLMSSESVLSRCRTALTLGDVEAFYDIL